MIFSALILIAAAELDAFDAANDRLTACGFSVHRDAAQANLDLPRFRSALQSGCGDEIKQMRQAIIAVESGRGLSDAAANASADQTIARFRESFADGYAQRGETESKLEQLIDALEKEGKADAE